MHLWVGQSTGRGIRREKVYMHCYCIKRILMVAYTQVKRMYIIEKGHIGIVEKAKETSSDIGNVCMCHYCAMENPIQMQFHVHRYYGY